MVLSLQDGDPVLYFIFGTDRVCERQKAAAFVLVKSLGRPFNGSVRKIRFMQRLLPFLRLKERNTGYNVQP